MNRGTRKPDFEMPAQMIQISLLIYARLSLRKHAYSNTLKILLPKRKISVKKKSDIFNISAQSIDCGCSLEPPRRGGSNEHPHSVSLSKIRKIIYTPVNTSFTI